MGFSLPALPTVYSPGNFGIGQHVIYYDDFLRGGAGTSIAGKFATTADAAEWLVTADNAGSHVIADASPGGILRITPGTGAGDFRSMQLNGESFAVQNNKKMWFGARFALSDADDGPWFVGMASTDVSGATLGPIYDGTNDSLGFRAHSSSSAVIDYVVEDDATETTASTAYSLTDAGFIEIGFYLNGRSYIEMYVNTPTGGGRVVKTSANIPDNLAYVTPTVEIGSTTGTTATYMDLDWIYCIQER